MLTGKLFSTVVCSLRPAICTLQEKKSNLQNSTSFKRNHTGGLEQKQIELSLKHKNTHKH